LIGDPDHSGDEDRFLLLGYSFQARCLIVSHCYRESEALIRVDLSQASHSARRGSVLESQMRKEYDFSKSRKNPYASQLKSQITIRLDTSAVHYFKQMAAELGIPYQNLINLFLRDCAPQKRRPSIQWMEREPKQPLRRKGVYSFRDDSR
jgi:predicted DNA binding CopG/RHH family protein